MKLALLRRILWAACACIAFAQGAARAELPSVKLNTASLVTPASAWTYYGGGTTHTVGVIGWTSANRPSEIKELARSLSRGGLIGGDPFAAAVADYVRYNIATEFRFGVSKGARGAVIDQSGTAFDQAHLMVEILRQGGAAASYQLGTITLNASQFQDWTGITNAAAACQYLADGGIPATVNGGSCTGSVSSVVMGHLWVSTGGKLYDPAYKKHVYKAGIDIAAALGCGTAGAPTCGTTIAALIPAPGAVSGVQRITAVPEVSINAQLKSYAVNLENWIQNYNATNNTSLTIEDVIGGKVIDTSAVFTAGSALPYTSAVQASWTGDIPDQYRTTLTVQFDNINQALFVDELAGKRLRIVGNGLNGSTRIAALYAEYKPLAKSSYTMSSTSAVLTLTANHPYAADGGAYMDEAVQRETLFSFDGFYNVLTLLNGWGDATRSTVSHFGALQARDLNSMVAEDPSNANHYWPTFVSQLLCENVAPPTTPIPDLGCWQQQQPGAAANWLAQTSRLAALAAEISDAQVQMHHSLGTVFSGEQLPMTILNSETSLSISSNTGNAGDRRAAFHGIAAGMSRLEGSVFEQAFDSWDGGSAVSYLVKSNAKGFASLWIDSSNVATALGQLTNYSQARKDVISSFAANGFAVIAPANGFLGSYSYVTNNALVINTNATAAYNTAGDRAAYLVDGQHKGASAGAAPNPSEAALNSVKQMEYSLKAKKYYGINEGTGEFTLSPPPDLVTGSGDFPFSLPFRRVYASAAPLEAIESSVPTSGARDALTWRPNAQSVSDLGGGWSHNYDISARMGSDGFKGMGIDSAREAAAAIAGLYTAARLSAGTPSFTNHMATIFATNWWIARLQSNIVTVRRAPDTAVFTRLADDTSFAPPPGSAERLTQTGNRVFKVWLSGFGSGYNYNGVGYTLTDASGGVLTLSHFTSNSYNADIAVPTSMVGASGVKLSFTNGGEQICVVNMYGCLRTVSNSLGRSLTLDPSLISDDSGRQVAIQSEHGSWAQGADATKNNAVLWIPTKIKVTSPDGFVTIYQYLGNPLAATERYYPKIDRWFTPSNAITPYITIAYDSLYRAKTATDNLAHATNYFVSGIYGSENLKPSWVADPLGNLTGKATDGKGQLVAVTDPLNRTSRKVFDNAGRLIREIMPEGNAVEYQYDVRNNRTRECRIAKGRVAWANLNSVTEQAPQCNAGAGDLVTTTAYTEGPGVWVCTNPKTCNKPSSIIDPKGNRTNFTWEGNHGGLLTETKGLNSAGSCALSGGSCPVATYAYTAFTGSDGATFYLPTSKTETISAGVSRITTWAYNTANKFALKEQVVDSGGLSLRTCFGFDAVGNLISKTEPKAGLASCP